MSRTKSAVLSIFIAILFLASCDSDGNNSNDNPDPTPMPMPTPTPIPDIENQFGLINPLPNLTFANPLDIQNANDGSNRLFVAEQRGVIRVIIPESANVATRIIQQNATTEDFLDIQDRVLFDDREFGLLGFAFHPNYENNGFVFVNYTTSSPSRSIISRFTVSPNNSNSVDTESELILLEILQPNLFHNGGQLVFGPQDGYLYISMGDGGPVSGMTGTGQDLTDLLGDVIRIDVDNPQGQLNYGIPNNNPFAGNTQGFREEIYAYGFRNPWRLAFDAVSGTLWTGDVGESSREEINMVINGGNYGWDTVEGTLCFNPPNGCNPSDFILPVIDYGRSQGGSVIGGVFYYGDIFPELSGLYIYADFVSGRVWALDHDGNNVVDNVQLLQFNPFSIVAFGTDEQGEPYIASFDGNIYRLERIQN